METEIQPQYKYSSKISFGNTFSSPVQQGTAFENETKQSAIIC